MGMFDTVNFECPKCNGIIEEQSKAGSCDLYEYGQGSVPLGIAASLDGDVIECPHCGEAFRIEADSPKTVRLLLKPANNDCE